MGTIDDCCDRRRAPIGFAYTVPTIESCNVCPTGKLWAAYFITIV